MHGLLWIAILLIGWPSASSDSRGIDNVVKTVKGIVTLRTQAIVDYQQVNAGQPDHQDHLVNTLKSNAANTHTGLLAWLGRRKASGSVTEIKPHWSFDSL